MKKHTVGTKPLVSVVTVVFNDEEHIEKTIQSVIRQTYDNIEYIIVDGFSSDATCSIINQYIENIDVFISEKDQGVYDAMNKAIQLAKGEWILFLNSGDIFYDENVIDVVFSNYIDNGESMIYGDTIYYNPKTGERQKVIARRVNNEKESFMPSCHQSIFTRANELKEHPFDLRYKVIADSNFYYELDKRNGKAKYTGTIISIYDSTGLSARNKMRNLKEKYWMYYRHNNPKCLLYLIRIIKNFVFNHDTKE